MLVAFFYISNNNQMRKCAFRLASRFREKNPELNRPGTACLFCFFLEKKCRHKNQVTFRVLCTDDTPVVLVVVVVVRGRYG